MNSIIIHIIDHIIIHIIIHIIDHIIIRIIDHIIKADDGTAANPGSPLYPTAWGNATLVKASLLHAKISEATHSPIIS